MPFNQKLQKFNAKINTVTIGSGDKTVTIGGDSTYPFYSFDAPSENTPKIGVEISDMGLENVVSEGIKAYYDGASTIGEMAKKAAAMEGADFVALILEGGDPNGVNKSVDELTARAAFAISGSLHSRTKVLPRPAAFSTSAVYLAASAPSPQFTYTSSAYILSPIRS